MKVEVAVLGSPSLIVGTELELDSQFRTQELCESRGRPPLLPVPNNRYGFGGRKATLNCVVFQSPGAV